MAENIVVIDSQQGPLHGKEGPGTTRSLLDKEYNILHIFLYMAKYKVELP